MNDVRVLTPAPIFSTVDEADITTDRLSGILTSAVFDNAIDEAGDIYVSDGLDWPTWVTVDTDRRLLGFFTYQDFQRDVDSESAQMKLLEFVNAANAKVIVVQFSVSDDRLNGHYWMTYDTRLDPRHFIKMLRLFSEVFASVVVDLQAQEGVRGNRRN
jgi:hypothetical protein